MSMSNRRYKIVAIDPMAIIALFRLNKAAPDRLAFPAFPDLPEGYDVIDVAHDFNRRCLVFIVSHPDFPEVPLNEEADVIESKVGSQLSEYVNVASLDQKVKAMYDAIGTAEFKPRVGEAV